MAATRKLVAILSADVAGYSRLMGEDDRATLEALTAYREVMRRHIGEHGGRVIDTPGDALLAEFPSAVEALQSAMDIQEELAGRNEQLPENRRMRMRIGVNLGDVLEQEGALYGDGVNIAARLESLADPGGVCISSWVYDNVKSKLPYGFENLGKRTVKNIAEPVEVYRVLRDAALQPIRHTHKKISAKRKIAVASISAAVILGVVTTLWYTHFRTASTTQPARGTASLPLPAMPSLAVLPFQNMSGKVDEDWYSDGFTETLITDLSRLSHLVVIARNSSFAYKGKAVDVRQIGRDLGVRYVLEGSVQRAANLLRINAQLVEAETGRHLWAQRYDRKADDVFEIQDDITHRIVEELDVKLVSGEQNRVWRKATRNREAYELWAQSLQVFNSYSREGISKARELNERALKLDPRFTLAMVSMGWNYFHQADMGWVDNPRKGYEKAVEWGRKAISIDENFGDAYAMMANAMLNLEQHREAVAYAGRAITLIPNSSDAIVQSAWVLAMNGNPQHAIGLIQRALRLNPIPGDWYYGGLGDSLLFSKRVEEAIPAHRKCVERLPDFIWCQLGLAIDYVLVGKSEDARTHAKEALRINPNITATDNTYVRSIGDPEERKFYADALRQSGLK